MYNFISLSRYSWSEKGAIIRAGLLNIEGSNFKALEATAKKDFLL